LKEFNFFQTIYSRTLCVQESVGTLSTVIQEQEITDEMYDAFMEELCNDDDDDILQLTDDTFKSLFQIDEPILEYFSYEVSKEVEEGESRQVPTDIPAHNVTKDTTSIIELTPNSSESVNISTSPGVVLSNASTPTGEGPSQVLAQELGGNMGVVNPILTSTNCSYSSLSLNNPNSWFAGPNAWNHPNGVNSTTVRAGTMDPPRVHASFGNRMFPNIQRNSITPFQSPSFPVLPSGGSSSNILQQFPRSLPSQMYGINARGTSAMVHRFNHGPFWPRPPSLSDFDNMVCAWKVNYLGSLFLFIDYQYICYANF